MYLPALSAEDIVYINFFILHQLILTRQPKTWISFSSMFSGGLMKEDRQLLYMFKLPNNLERRFSSHRFMLFPSTRTHNTWQIVSVAFLSRSLRIDNKKCLLRLTKKKSRGHSTYKYEQARLLTNNVAFMNGTWTPSDLDSDLIPPALKPIIVHAITQQNKMILENTFRNHCHWCW